MLHDADFRIPRVKWAQLAAEPMITKLCTSIQRHRNVDVGTVLNCLPGDGLYAVWLDKHVGFLLKRGTKVDFVHAGYYRPETGVLAEAADGYKLFTRSSYKVVGKLLDDNMVQRWTTGTSWQ